MNSLKLKVEPAIHEIIRWFECIYPDADGVPSYRLDGRTGKPLDRRNLLPELDDYLPFFWMLGRKDYVWSQIEYLKYRFNKYPLLFDRPQIRNKRGVRLPFPLREFICHQDSQDYVEILYALLEIQEMSKDLSILELAERLYSTVLRAFRISRGIATWHIPLLKSPLPIRDAFSGMYIEISADLARATGKEEYLKQAQDWSRWWVESAAFQRYGLFASVEIDSGLRRLPGLKRHSMRFELAKSNTAVASGLLALAGPPFHDPAALKSLNRWVEGLEKYCRTPEGTFAHNPRFEVNGTFGPVLSTNFAAIDLLCDLFQLTQDPRALALASNAAQGFMKYQSPETGLFPDEIPGIRSYLDGNTDLIVSLHKLWELTGDDGYRSSAQRALEGVLQWHRLEVGYARDVDMNTGRILNSDIETRFVSLFLKPLLLVSRGLQIYGSDDWSRFRDR